MGSQGRPRGRGWTGRKGPLGLAQKLSGALSLQVGSSEFCLAPGRPRRRRELASPLGPPPSASRPPHFGPGSHSHSLEGAEGGPAAGLARWGLKRELPLGRPATLFHWPGAAKQPALCTWQSGALPPFRRSAGQGGGGQQARGLL